MSSVPARELVSGERRNPNPSGSTSSVPSPKMLSPFFAWFLSSAKIRSCLRKRLAPSISLVLAISTSSVTGLDLRSDRCIGGPGAGDGNEKSGARHFWPLESLWEVGAGNTLSGADETSRARYALRDAIQ